MDNNKEIVEEFLYDIRTAIYYWDKQNISSQEKLEGLAFSMLCMLDGVSCGFEGTIEDLCNASNGYMLHEYFQEVMKRGKQV